MPPNEPPANDGPHLAPARPAEPTQLRSSPLRSALSGRRGVLGAAIGVLAGWQAAEAMVPVLVGVIIDRAIATGDTGALVRWVAALALLFVVLSSGYRFGARLTARATEHAGLDLRLVMAARILHPGGGAGRGRRPGELLSVATVDVSRTADINELLAFGVVACTGLTVAAVVLLAASVQLGLVVLLGLPPVLFALNLLTGTLEKRSSAEQEHDAQATALATDVIAGLRVLQGLGAGPAAAARYRSASRAALRARVRSTRLLALHAGLAVAVTNTFLALVALVGGRLAAQGRISIGELVAAVGLTAYLIGPISWLAGIAAGAAQSRASAARVAAVLEDPSAVTGGTSGPSAPAAGALRIAGLWHGPLAGLDLAVGAGELVAITVPDQGAALVLLDCLAREVAPEAGSITLDGTELACLDLDQARAAVLVAAHDADLFEDTVAGNVAFTAAGPEQVGAAITAAAAGEVMAAVPAGTALTEWARSLSGGQRQRLALARSLAADPAVLVLHDPTTAVDPVTEAAIAAGIRALRTGRTTVILTSSPPLLAVADRVVLLTGGVLAAQGSHRQLAESSAAYREAVFS